MPELPNTFVYLSEAAPTIWQDIRYATSYNFTGRPISGYRKGVAILTRQAAHALSKAQQQLQVIMGAHYSLKVYDAYRPQKAVDDFIQWTQDKDEVEKQLYYPQCTPKTLLLDEGYIARKSAHTRGSTVDVTLIDLRKKEQFNPATGADNSIDMGTIFDYFGEESHVNYPNLPAAVQGNRACLQTLMQGVGFVPIPQEWWHFTLQEEPFPSTYFNFDVA